MAHSIIDGVLTFDDTFNEPIEKWFGLITDDIIGIDLSKSDDFDYPIDKLAQTNIRILKLGTSFRQSLDNLPLTLKVLDMEYAEQFDSPINNLPDGLEVLKLGYFFNQPINNLPKTLKVLYTNCYFNHPLDNLPIGLINLRIGGDYTHNIDNLPETIQVMEIGEQCFCPYDNLPINITFLTICSATKKTIEKLPPNLQTLVLKYSQNFYVDLNVLPTTLNQIYLIESKILNSNSLIKKYPHIQIKDDYGFAR